MASCHLFGLDEHAGDNMMAMTSKSRRLSRDINYNDSYFGQLTRRGHHQAAGQYAGAPVIAVIEEAHRCELFSGRRLSVMASIGSQCGFKCRQRLHTQRMIAKHYWQLICQASRNRNEASLYERGGSWRYIAMGVTPAKRHY